MRKRNKLCSNGFDNSILFSKQVILLLLSFCFEKVILFQIIMCVFSNDGCKVDTVMIVASNVFATCLQKINIFYENIILKYFNNLMIYIFLISY